MIKATVIFGSDAVRHHNETGEIPSKEWLLDNGGVVDIKTFNTREEYVAYTEGVNDADGWNDHTILEPDTVDEQSETGLPTVSESAKGATYHHRQLVKLGMDLPEQPSADLLDKLHGLVTTARSLRATYDKEQRTLCVYRGRDMVFIKRLHPLEDDNDSWFGACIGGVVYDLNLFFDDGGDWGYLLTMYLVEVDKNGHYGTTDYWYRVELTTTEDHRS